MQVLTCDQHVGAVEPKRLRFLIYTEAVVQVDQLDMTTLIRLNGGLPYLHIHDSFLEVEDSQLGGHLGWVEASPGKTCDSCSTSQHRTVYTDDWSMDVLKAQNTRWDWLVFVGGPSSHPQPTIVPGLFRHSASICGGNML